MKKELLFILFIILLFFAIHGFQINTTSILEDATIDLNVHDTYFVIPKVYYWTYTLLFLFSICYLIRILVLRFANRLANYIYVIVNALLIVWLIFEIHALNVLFRDFQQNSIEIDQLFYYFFYFITTALIFSVIFEVYVLYKVWNQKQETSKIHTK
ncbi:hypothetical protein EZY14_003350 [Kordia sp. TARA_039_SRF]|nr:hypothetical protein EZY14_003350 [Kordia sp. TARA_039_SRF]